ncbi:MAG: type VI-B CRISPR-associated RNA-guided ribonuclease Cas13b [Bacteroidales bacterium]
MDKDNNKFVFGAYLNIAYDNFNDACKLLLIRSEIRSGEKDAWVVLSEELHNLEEEKPMKLLKCRRELDRVFPFFTIIDDNRNISYANIIQSFGKQLKSLRNYHTHYYHPEYDITNILEQPIFDHLDKIYDNSLSLVIKRFKPDSRTIEHLYRLNKNGEKTYKFRYNFASNIDRFTDPGLAFLISLFLSKGDGIRLLKKLSGFKRSDSVSYRLTTEVFTVLRMHLPRQTSKLLHIQSESESIALDILNEISKCPKELYFHLPDVEKEKFIVKDSDDGDVIGERIRYKDRYEQQILRILENDDSFKNISFYLYLGICNLTQYDKVHIDGSKDKRTLTSPLYGFAKIKDSQYSVEVPHTLDQLEEGAIKEEPLFLSSFGERMHNDSSLPVTHTTYLETRGEEEDEQTFPSIRESYPFFVVNDNKIGIKFLDSDTESYFPTVTHVTASRVKVKNPQPDIWISKYELPAMAFYAFIKKEYPDATNSLPSVIDILKEAKRACSQPKPKKKLPARERIVIALNRYIQECADEIQKIEKCKVSGIYKIGELADRLVRDILWLQPSHEGGKDKVTGANFQVLQYALARYTYKRDELTRIFSQANLLEKKNKHPFLSTLEPAHHNTFIDFYLAYYAKKKSYLFQQQQKLAKGKSNIQFHPVRKLVREMQNSNTHQVPESTFLCRNLFRDNIRIGLCNVRADLKNDIRPELGVSQLINLFMGKIERSQSQNFYTVPRTYRLRSNESEYEYLTQSVKDREDYLKMNYSDLTIKCKRRDILDNERVIRLRMTQDQTLFLWMRKYLPKELTGLKGGEKEIKISEVSSDLLNTNINVRVKFEDIVLEDSVKLKDYSRIKSLGYHKLSLSLFKFIGFIYKDILKEKKLKLPLSYEYIERELNAFELYRVEVIDIIHTLEMKLCWCNRLCKQDENSKEGYYEFGTIMDLFKEEEDSDIINALKYIRNSFAHSNYPDEYDVLKKTLFGSNTHKIYGEAPQVSFKDKIVNIVQKKEKGGVKELSLAYVMKVWFEDRINLLINKLD